jgi:nucleolar protein 14
MEQDTRSKPTDRTKNAEEIASAEAARLKDAAEDRLRRFRGEALEVSDDADEGKWEEADDAAHFGFKVARSRDSLDVEDEDDFVIDENLVGSGSESDAEIDTDLLAGSDVDDDASGENELNFDADELLSDSDRGEKLAFEASCPVTHEELLEQLKSVSQEDSVRLVQRIRLAYKLDAAPGNRTKLAQFAVVLVEHLCYMGECKPAWPLSIVEAVIRHIHSLSRTFSTEIASAFRTQLLHMREAHILTGGHMMILGAIGTIYPTSDLWHQVVTPAALIIGRWLERMTPEQPKDFKAGAYLGALCIQYQTFSKRYVPELVSFTIKALTSRKCPASVKMAHLQNVTAMSELWSTKSAFVEIINPRLPSRKPEGSRRGQSPAHEQAPSVLSAVQQLCKDSDRLLAKASQQTLQRIKIMLAQSRSARRPLALHNWPPLPIKMAIPKFEEHYNPDRHYDPDRERHESNKLRAEYKNEKKRAMRELRKDANFIARESLREKKERDRAYEEKQRRLIAEINAEEGAEANAYEREKRRRKGRS